MGIRCLGNACMLHCINVALIYCKLNCNSACHSIKQQVPGILNDYFLFKEFIPFIFVRVFISVPLTYERLEINPIPDLQLLSLHNTSLPDCLGQLTTSCVTQNNINQKILHAGTQSSATKITSRDLVLFFSLWRVSRAQDKHWAKPSVRKDHCFEIWNKANSLGRLNKLKLADAAVDVCEIEKQTELFVCWPCLSRSENLCCIWG